jgi:hypothetical protein
VKKAPAAIAGAWRSPQGKIAINVASISESALTLSVRIDPAVYGLRRGARVWRVDEAAGRRLVGEIGATAAPIAVTLPPLGAAMFELEGR